MKILVISPFPVGPRSFGGMLRLYRWVKYLIKNNHKVHLVYFIRKRELMPLDNTDLITSGCKIDTIKMTNRSLLERVGDRLKLVPVPTAFFGKKYARVFIENIINEGNFDLIHVEFGYLSACLDFKKTRNIKKVLVEEDLYFMLKKGYQDRITNIRSLVDLLEIKRLRQYEIANIDNYDKVFAVTLKEQKSLEPYTNHTNLEVFPNTIDSRNFSLIKFGEKFNSILFLGDYTHKTNIDGVKWFIEKCWSLIIEETKDVKLILAGANPSRYIRSLSKQKNIIVPGYVEALNDILNMSNIFIVPIVSSSGMRGKVLEAMASGKAIISTSRGIAGIEVEDGKDVFIADDPVDFARRVIELIKDPEKCRDMGDNAKQQVALKYDDAIVFPRIENEFQSLIREESLIDIQSG